MRFVRSYVLTVALLLLSGSAAAQVVVPSFGTRGDVADELVAEFMPILRVAVAESTRLRVLPGDLITRGIAGSLEPDFALLIAELGGGRYGVSGEISRLRDGQYSITVLVADRESQATSDLITRSFPPNDLAAASSSVSGIITEFVRPASALPAGRAELFVASQPRGAQVTVNGIPVGETGDVGVLSLAPGTYVLEVRRDGFLPHLETVQVRIDRPTFLNVTLVAVMGGSLQLTSLPTADVYIDDVFAGRTPLVTQARPGMRHVRFERPGFAPVEESVIVRNFRVSRAQAVLVPEAERLLFWEPIRGTLVFVDGLLRVQNYVEGLRGGLHTIEVWNGTQRERFRLVLPTVGVFQLDLVTRELIPLSPQ